LGEAEMADITYPAAGGSTKKLKDQSGYHAEVIATDAAYPLSVVGQPGKHDYKQVASSDASGNPLVIVYKLGGAGGTLVGTQTLTYDANGNLATETWS
jgi:hypothetical protein